MSSRDTQGLTPREKQACAIVAAIADPAREPKACSRCATRTALTEDWTLYPWPDGLWLCRPCNDERFDSDAADDDWGQLEDQHPG